MLMSTVDTWKVLSRGVVAAVVVVAIAQGSLLAQAPQQPGGPGAQMPMPAGSTPPAPAGAVQAAPVVPNTPPADYVIGADDILTVKVWQDERMSGDVVVRPDGMVTLALINDIAAAGLTPEQFRAAVKTAAGKFVQEPTVDVVVKQINSRRVFMTGEVAKPAAYPLSSRMTVMQAIAMAGGLTEYANKGRVTILRTEGGKTVLLRVNYGDILNGKNLNQNYELKVGDVVTVSD
jgi:polysaccharide export outer membrane protein